MKIGIVTIHSANSYGGMLQAFATQEFFGRYGDTSIIDYKSEHIEKTMNLLRFGDGSRGLLRGGKDLFRVFPRKRLLENFKKFSNKFLNIDKIEKKHLNNGYLDKYDVIVSGSDQIWNPKIMGGLDKNYFLDFNFSGKRISFASSMGSYKYSENELLDVKSMLQKYNFISVREGDTANYLSSSLGFEVKKFADPTLMIAGSDWRDRFNIIDGCGGYIAIYALKKNDLMKKIINKTVKKLGMKSVAIDQDPFVGYNVDRHVNDAGPEDYLKIIGGSSFIITNSFHGTVFALNFNIPFLVIPPESGENRIKGILSDCGMINRYCESLDDVDSIVGLGNFDSGDALGLIRSNVIDSMDYFMSKI